MTKHFSYLKIFIAKKSERAILQHKEEQEKCRALMARSAGGKIHPTVLESSILERKGRNEALLDNIFQGKFLLVPKFGTRGQVKHSSTSLNQREIESRDRNKLWAI